MFGQTGTSFSSLQSIADVSYVNASLPSVVFGILVAPHAATQRQALRDSWIGTSACTVQPRPGRALFRWNEPQSGKLLVRFVVEFGAQHALQEEQAEHGDLEFVHDHVQASRSHVHVHVHVRASGGTSDTPQAAALLRYKPLRWLQHAAARWPTATFIGKLDTDTYVWPCLLLRDLHEQLLRAVSDATTNPYIVYGSHILWKGCARRGAPPMSCYAQGGLYVLSWSLANATRGSAFRKLAASHPPADYAFEDVTFGWWVRKLVEDESAHTRREAGAAPSPRLILSGHGHHGDRSARLAALRIGRHDLGPYVHLNLGSGGNVTYDPGLAEHCRGVYAELGCCPSSLGKKVRRHCPAMESEACRRDPMRAVPVGGCLGKVDKHSQHDANASSTSSPSLRSALGLSDLASMAVVHNTTRSIRAGHVRTRGNASTKSAGMQHHNAHLKDKGTRSARGPTRLVRSDPWLGE